MLLSPNGVCYLVLIEDNNPPEVIQILKSLNLYGIIILRTQAYNESLLILRIVRNINKLIETR